MLDITMQLDISTRLTPEVTTIICHHMKKNIIQKKKKNIGELDQNSYVNKNNT